MSILSVCQYVHAKKLGNFLKRVHSSQDNISSVSR